MKRERGMREKLVLDPLCLREREEILRNCEKRLEKGGWKGDLLEHVLWPQSPLLPFIHKGDWFSQSGKIALSMFLI
jgi:hypothetical protein